MKFLVNARGNLQAYRPVLIGYTSVLRIVAFILSALAITSWQGIEPRDFFDGFWMKEYNYTVSLVNQSLQEGSEVISPAESRAYILEDRWIPLYVVLVQALSALCVYNCSKSITFE